MRHSSFFVVGALCVVVACGSEQSTTSTTQSEAGPPNDAAQPRADGSTNPASCPASVPDSGGTCSVPAGTQCTYGCNFCSCNSGKWLCQAPGCAGGCLPGPPPAAGSACGGCCGPGVGQTCDYACPGAPDGGDAGTLQAKCQSPGTWEITTACSARDGGTD